MKKITSLLITLLISSVSIAQVSITTTSPDTSICIGGTATLFATATGGNPPITLIWDNGLLGNGPHQVNPTANSTTYNVYAQDANGTVSDTHSIIISTYPPIIINNIYLLDTIICFGETTTIVANATGGGTGLIYTWYDGNNNIIGITDTGMNVITPNYDGEIFSVDVSDSCTTPTQTNNITSHVDTCTGINETLDDFGLIVYPNPSNGKFVIEKSVELKEAVRVKILDVTSKLILETSIEKGSQSINIDISKYNSGIYYIQLTINDKIHVQQILKN